MLYRCNPQYFFVFLIFSNRLCFDKKRKPLLTAVQRRLGEYWSKREARSIASGGIRLWKIWNKKLNDQSFNHMQTSGTVKKQPLIYLFIFVCVCCTHSMEEEETAHLVPWVGFYLRESKICVIWIHASNFFASWSTKNL